MAKTVDLSIIVPAHNEENFIESTLLALMKSAQATNVDFEIIVVNDDSSDQTEAIAIRLGVSVENVKLRNIGAVRNAGAARAAGRWLVFVDADTIVPTETLRSTVEALSGESIGGGARVDLDDLNGLPWTKRMMFHGVVTLWQRMGNWAAGCYMFCEAEAFREFGGFDEAYYAAEELFFSRNLKRLGKFTLVPNAVITSSRKLNGYSVFQLVRFLIRPIFTRKGVFKSKTGLELLYEDKR